MIESDILIIGAGPTGLFAVFEAGLLKMKCHLIDALPQVGGQCSELYPKKPIYDIPAYPEILAGDLTEKLMEQCKQFEPGFTLGERAETIEKQADGAFIVTTNKGTKHKAPVVAIAGGLGSFEPRKPQLDNIAFHEDKGVAYIIKDPEVYRDKKVVISGGGDSALDYQTNIPGIFAIGDVNTYPGKLKLILCGFHEATLMCQAAYQIINPGKRYVLKYTTVSGIDGFDGTRKEAPKAVVKSIN